MGAHLVGSSDIERLGGDYMGRLAIKEAVVKA